MFSKSTGIPGFDDALIPRVVGGLGGALLAANHLLEFAGGVAASPAQGRTEALGLALAIAGLVSPSIEQQLKCELSALRDPTCLPFILVTLPACPFLPSTWRTTICISQQYDRSWTIHRYY